MRWVFLFFVWGSLAGMTLEEKAGRCLIASFVGEEVNDEARRLIGEAKVGGIIYFNHTNGLRDLEKVRKLSEGLQALSKYPLLIGVDQEGGEKVRFREGVTQSPWNRAIRDAKEAYELGYQVAVDLRTLGINLNFAPVVDVDTNPDNPVIGKRSFGSDPRWVAELGEAALQGYLDGGVLPCLKHFPGHGDTSTDSHFEMAVVEKNWQELLACELVPYIRLAKKTPLIMTAHVIYPELDPDNPATLSSKILQGILREKLGFKGLIISDCLTMKGVGENVEEVAVRALQAGCNLLLIGAGDVELAIRVQKAIVEAVKNGVLPEEKLCKYF